MDLNVAMVVIYSLLNVNPACGESMNTTFKDKIIGFLQELCPRSGVCSNEDEDKKSCCRACSCAPDCFNDNCCFPEQPENRSDGTTIHPLKRPHSQCLYPLSEPHEDALTRVLNQAYYMVTSSLNEKSSSVVPCGDMQVASWGSLYPVFSLEDGTIYKNRFCAEENHVTEWELWDGYLVCDDKNAASTASLYDGMVPETCKIQFDYDVDLLESEICYVRGDYKDICWEDEFPIPAITTASKDEIITACISGTMSPYRGFVNVFCNICSGQPLGTCSETHDGYKGTFGQPGFAAFIDSRYLHTSSNDESESYTMTIPKQNLNTACIVNDVQNDLVQEECRRISCPAGQIYDDTNTCIYPGNKWLVKRIMLQLDITSEQPFSIIPLLTSFENLKSPFSKGWNINMVMYRGTNENNILSSIIVVQTLNFQKPFKPSIVLKRIHKAVNKPWLLVSNNATTSLNAKFYGRPLLGHDILYSSNDFEIVDAAPITCLYFCDQVALHPGEYVYNRHDSTLTNLITNDTVFKSDFTWIDTLNGTSPAVCLDTSGLQRMVTSNALTPEPCTVVCLIMVLLSKALQTIIQ